MNTINENQFIQKLTGHFHRSPLQINQLQESDAEIIQLSLEPLTRLALTTDSIAEEISLGLYDDPYLIGWMAVMVNMSDLAAVGAEPLGLLTAEVLPHDYPSEALSRLQEGIHDACTACSTYILGGDTNAGERLVITGCAVGKIIQNQGLSRMGCSAGDLLYTTNVLGVGNAFALSRIMNLEAITGKRVNYHPRARLTEGQTLCGLASACMDTSDGVISTLDQLMRLNNVGFALEENWESLLHPEAKELALTAGIPPWLMLAGQHGEFELVFTVPQHLESCLLDPAKIKGWLPLRLGKVVEEPAVSIPLYGERIRLDTARIRNLPNEVNGAVDAYIKQLCSIDTEIQRKVYDNVNT